MPSAMQRAGDIMGRMRSFRGPVTEERKFTALGLAKEAMEVHDAIPDIAGSDEITREMLRKEVGAIQQFFGWQA